MLTSSQIVSQNRPFRAAFAAAACRQPSTEAARRLRAYPLRPSCALSLLVEIGHYIVPGRPPPNIGLLWRLPQSEWGSVVFGRGARIGTDVRSTSAEPRIGRAIVSHRGRRLSSGRPRPPARGAAPSTWKCRRATAMTSKQSGPRRSAKPELSGRERKWDQLPQPEGTRTNNRPVSSLAEA